MEYPAAFRARQIIATLPPKGEKFVHIFQKGVAKAPCEEASGRVKASSSEAPTAVAGGRSTAEILDLVEALNGKEAIRDSRDGHHTPANFLRDVIADVRTWRR